MPGLEVIPTEHNYDFVGAQSGYTLFEMLALELVSAVCATIVRRLVVLGQCSHWPARLTFRRDVSPLLMQFVDPNGARGQVRDEIQGVVVPLSNAANLMTCFHATEREPNYAPQVLFFFLFSFIRC